MMEKLSEMGPDEKRQRGLSGNWWRNDLYEVGKLEDKPWNGLRVIHLHIKRHDRKPMTDSDWRNKQDIKNQLVGSECEGVELYPAESRRNDQANIYHLWVIDDPKYHFPFGWEGRATLDDE